jgi:hypothetical protein
MSWTRMFPILWRLQLRRWLNRLENWQGRRGTLVWGLMLLSFILVGLHLVMASSLDRLLDLDEMRSLLQRTMGTKQDLLRFTRYADVPDQSARLMLIFLQGTWLSALFLKWGHWQSLERDTEWEWFAERPWPSWALFVQRCFLESLSPQIFSLFIGSFFVLLGLRRGLPLIGALSWSVMLVLMLQALLAAPRAIVDLCLRQRWPAARLRVWRGISGIFGAGLLVLSMQSLSMDQSWSVQAVMRYGKLLDASPAGLALSSLILHDHAIGLHSAGMLFILVLVTHGLASVLAAYLLRQPLPGFQGWSRSSHKRQERGPGLFLYLWRRWHPLTRRDLILLSRDRHLMLQMLVAPCLVALLPQSLPLQEPAWVLVLAFGTGLLFLWSAVFQILPMEGRSLWMLYTWPQSLAQFLWRRLRLLLSLAAFYTMLLLTLAWVRADSHGLAIELWRLPYLALGLLGFGILLTALAVLSYEAEAQDGRERPRFLLHYAMLIPAGLYGWLLHGSTVFESLVGLLILSFAAAFVWWRMIGRLPRLLDRPVTYKKSLARVTLRLYLLKFMTR